MHLISLRPGFVAVCVAFSRTVCHAGRLCRVVVLFPDIGLLPRSYELGFLRYSGEKSFVKPDATEQELSLPQGLTTNFDWSKEHGWSRLY